MWKIWPSCLGSKIIELGLAVILRHFGFRCDKCIYVQGIVNCKFCRPMGQGIYSDLIDHGQDHRQILGFDRHWQLLIISYSCMLETRNFLLMSASFHMWHTCFSNPHESWIVSSSIQTTIGAYRSLRNTRPEQSL